jgi:hypothetical protein
MLLSRGNAISGAPIIKGTSQLPNPPIIIGITIKKIMMKAWAVTITLYVWSLPMNEPGCPSSRRIKTLKAAPVVQFGPLLVKLDLRNACIDAEILFPLS